MEMFVAPLMMYIFHNLFILHEYGNQCLTTKLLKQGYRYNKLHEAFSKFYPITDSKYVPDPIHSELIVK